MEPPGKFLTWGAAAFAAGAVATIGAVADRASRLRDPLDDLDESYEHTPSKTFSVVAEDGTHLHVQIDNARPTDTDDAPGEKPTIVFSHGYTLSSRIWVLQRRALAKAGFRVIAWDQRGHGRSGLCDADLCNLGQLGRDLHLVIEAACPDGPIVLVGHSMGGMTVMSCAAQFPELIKERVIGVALVATSAGGGPSLTNLGFGELFGAIVGQVGPGVLGKLSRAQRLVTPARKLIRGVEGALVHRYSFDSPVPERTIRYAGDIIMGTPLQVMADFLPTFESVDQQAALEAFTGVETLVINGEGDLMTPPEHSTWIVRGVPGAEHVVVADAGHLLMIEHPWLLTEQLLLLVERSRRALADGKVSDKPRVRRRVTDLVTKQQGSQAMADKAGARQRPGSTRTSTSGQGRSGARSAPQSAPQSGSRSAQPRTSQSRTSSGRGGSTRSGGSSRSTRRRRTA